MPDHGRQRYARSVPYLTAPEDLAAFIGDEPTYRADQFRHWLYKTPVRSIDSMTNLPPAMRDALRDRLWPFEIEQDLTGDGGRTKKWLFRLPDGPAIEAVLMGYSKRTTLCISSQAGCALGCTFCATGQFGFDRHLAPGEIVAQVAYANAFLREEGIEGSPGRVTNVVFMGMGEPLANYDRVRESLRRLIEVMGMGARSITVSTVGVVPGIDRLADEPWQVGLAISLHAADDELRSSLVPLNRRYPISELIRAAVDFREKTGRRVSIEWTLMDGVNDSVDQARKLANIARRMRAHINVIAMNPTPLSAEQPSREGAISAFMDELESAGISATRRHMRGLDIDAACGQLRARSEPGPGMRPAPAGA